jgi:hypothetical protein
MYIYIYMYIYMNVEIKIHVYIDTCIHIYTLGYGTLLMEEAERVAINEHNSDKILVISGVGTRLCSALSCFLLHSFIYFLFEIISY